MLTAITATLGAAFFGCADFLGGFASRKAPALLVTITAQATGIVILTVVTLLARPENPFDIRALWGVGAGVLGGTGVLALYAGLATGRMSVVAPVTAALSGALPAAVGLSTGATPSTVSMVGMALALVAVVIVSSSPEPGEASIAPEASRRALMLAIVAGVGFAGSILCFSRTPAETGMVPLVLSRLTAVTIFTVAALVRGMPLLPERGARGWAVGTGVLDSMANAAQVTALRLGPLALASVLGALYPVATVLLARFVLHEHLHGWQRIGIVLALIAVVMCAWP